jgi:hypothetical protein
MFRRRHFLLSSKKSSLIKKSAGRPVALSGLNNLFYFKLGFVNPDNALG